MTMDQQGCLPADDLFEFLGRVAAAVARTVGPQCEVVVHDLRDPEHSVVAISGNLTRRAVGAPVSDPGMLPANIGRYTEDALLERLETPFGKELLSSAVWVRDRSGAIIGALCVNVDFSGLRQVRDALDRMIVDYEEGDGGSPAPVTFAGTSDEFVDVALTGVVRETGKPVERMDRQDKVRVVWELDRLGVFNLRGAVEKTASTLGVSRASVYSYLQASRADEPALNGSAR